MKELNNTLLYGPRLFLTFGEKEYKSALRKIKASDAFYYLNDVKGCCYAYKVDGVLWCIVDLNPDALKATVSPVEVIHTIIHESVHVWQNFETISGAGNEACFGREGEANGIENIAATLIEEFRKRRG